MSTIQFNSILIIRPLILSVLFIRRILMNGIESSESHGEHNSVRGSTMNYNADSSVYHAEAGMPLDRLKQLLSTQLEYYFSR